MLRLPLKKGDFYETHIAYRLAVIHSTCSHGRRKDFFQGGPPEDFSKTFLGGAKSGEICFFPVETKKKTFLLKFSKSRVSSTPFRRQCLQFRPTI